MRIILRPRGMGRRGTSSSERLGRRESAPERLATAEILNLEQMRRNFGRITATAVILLRRYAESTAPLIANIERAWTGRRVEDLYEVTHSALGASRTAGAEQLAAILSELQAAIKSSAWTETDALQARLAPAFARVKDAIEGLVPVEASRDER